MKKTTFLTAMCCSLLTIGTLRAELPTPVLDAPLNEEATDPATFPNGFKSINGSTAPGYAVDDVRGNVRTFNGAAGKMQTQAPLGVSGTAARTICYWGKIVTNAGDKQIMYTTGAAANTTGLFILMHKQDGKQIFLMNNGNSSQAHTKIIFAKEGAEAFGADTWYHCALVIADGAKGSEMKCYINGQHFADGDVKHYDNKSAGKANGNTDDFTYDTPAAAINVGHSIKGSLSQFKIFDVALTAEQVAELYSGTSTGMAANNVANRIQVQGKSIFVNGTADVQIFDATGRMIMQQSNVRGQMSAEDLSGIYILRANIDGEVATLKMVF